MKASYKFIFNKKKGRNAAKFEKPIDIEIYINAQNRLFFTTKIKVEEKFWDEKRGEIKKSHPLAVEFNNYLSKLKNDLHRAELDAIERGIVFDVNYIKALLNDANDITRGSFIEYSRRCNKSDLDAKRIKYSAWQKYETYLNNLQRFVDDEYKPNFVLKFKDITPVLIEKLDTWCTKYYAASTTKKFHIGFKKFIDRAIREKFILQDPYNGFKYRKERTAERVALTIDELTRLENLDRVLLAKQDANLVEVLDRFLFSCYCGLRISDSLLLSKRNIINTDSGLVVDMVTEKMNGARVILPLDILFGGKGASIAKRYIQLYPDESLLFPFLVEQKINIKLKTLALLAQIHTTLTFHIARHTCATMLAEKTGNPFIIMKILGHSNINTSMIYIHNSTQAVVNGLSATKW